MKAGSGSSFGPGLEACAAALPRAEGVRVLGTGGSGREFGERSKPRLGGGPVRLTCDWRELPPPTSPAHEPLQPTHASLRLYTVAQRSAVEPGMPIARAGALSVAAEFHLGVGDYLMARLLVP